MKRIFTTLLAVVLLASCFAATVNAADPTPTNVVNWTWIEEFDDSALSDKWIYTATSSSSASVADGKASIVNNVNAEAKLKYEDLVASNHYVLETKIKTTWATDNKGVVSVIFLTGGGIRIHSQIAANLIKVRKNGSVFDEYQFNFNDGQYHTIRYEVTLTGVGTDAAAGSYKLFVDGTYLGAGTEMNPMNGKRLEILNKPNVDATITTDIEYVKYVALDVTSQTPATPETPDTPENPETPENPDTPNDDENAPATGVAIVPVVLVATTALAGVVVSKKRR